MASAENVAKHASAYRISIDDKLLLGCHFAFVAV